MVCEQELVVVQLQCAIECNLTQENYQSLKL